MENEEWRAVLGYEGYYEVSSLGRVRSVPRTISGRWGKVNAKSVILKPKKSKLLYVRVELNKNAKPKIFLVHRLVASAFILNPENKPCVNHKNFDRTDNRVQNLEWCTFKENQLHAIAAGRFLPSLIRRSGEGSEKAKLTWKNVDEIREFYATRRYNQTELAAIYGVGTRAISKIVLGQRWIESRRPKP